MGNSPGWVKRLTPPQLLTAETPMGTDSSEVPVSKAA